MVCTRERDGVLRMLRTVVTVGLLVLFGLTLAGCSPCGFIWDDWRSGRSCHGEPAPK
jgi:hypothetical protein